MKRLLTLTALLLAAMVSQGLVWFGCDPERAEARLVTERVDDRLFVIRGGGGSTAVLVSDAGLVLVDTKLGVNGRQLLEAVRAISDRPVTTIVNTHYHADHIGNNNKFGEHVDIVANQRADAQLEQLHVDRSLRATRTFDDRLKLTVGGDTLDLYYFGRGHTGGDIVVVFDGRRVAHVGDLFPGKSVPVIDNVHGGSGVAFPDTLDRIVANIPDVDRVITGHSKVSTWDDLKQFARFNRDFLAWARGAFAAGADPDAASRASQLPKQYPDYELKPHQLKGNLEKLYEELGAPDVQPTRLWRGARTP